MNNLNLLEINDLNLDLRMPSSTCRTHST